MGTVRRITAAWVMVSLLAATLGYAQQPEDDFTVGSPYPTPTDEPVSDAEFRRAVQQQVGFPRMLNAPFAKTLLRSHGIQSMSDDYGIKEEHQDDVLQMLEAALDRWHAEHGQTWPKLIDTYQNAIQSRTPPPLDTAQQFATQFRAMLADVKAEIDRFHVDVRPFADPEIMDEHLRELDGQMQWLSKLDGELSEVERVGVSDERWAKLRDDIEHHAKAQRMWRQTRQRHRAERRNRRATAQHAATQPADDPADDDDSTATASPGEPSASPQQTPGEWQALVEVFIVEHALDEAQATSARNIGREVLARRQQLWAANEDVLDRSAQLDEYTLTRPKSAELKRVRAILLKLHEADDELFDELLARLEKLK